MASDYPDTAAHRACAFCEKYCDIGPTGDAFIQCFGDARIGVHDLENSEVIHYSCFLYWMRDNRPEDFVEFDAENPARCEICDTELDGGERYIHLTADNHFQSTGRIHPRSDPVTKMFGPLYQAEVSWLRDDLQDEVKMIAAFQNRISTMEGVPPEARQAILGAFANVATALASASGWMDWVTPQFPEKPDGE